MFIFSLKEQFVILYHKLHTTCCTWPVYSHINKREQVEQRSPTEPKSRWQANMGVSSYVFLMD